MFSHCYARAPGDRDAMRSCALIALDTITLTHTTNTLTKCTCACTMLHVYGSACLCAARVIMLRAILQHVSVCYHDYYALRVNLISCKHVKYSV